MFQMKKKNNQEIVCLFFTDFTIPLRVHGGGKVKHDSKNKPNKTINKYLQPHHPAIRKLFGVKQDTI